MPSKPEKRREQQRRWRADPVNREKRNQAQKEWAAKPESQEKRRQYVEKNRARLNEKRQQWRLANRDTIEAQRRARYKANGGALGRHGLDAAAWARMWEAQAGRCYLCGDPLVPDKSVIEHDHRCCSQVTSCPICRRGLACEECNKAIGLAHDDPARLRRIADALEVARVAVTERMAQSRPEQGTLL